MNARLTPLSIGLLAAFAVALGDFAFRTWLPPIEAEYRIAGMATPLSAPSTAEPRKHLYLRHKWTMTEAPETAWLLVQGHDVLEVYVNGRRANRTRRVGQGRVCAAITDITPMLFAGENTIAIHAAQLVIERPPRVAVDGACHFASGESLSLGDPNSWRASDVYDRRGSYWFEKEFAEEHWAIPTVGEPTRWVSQVALPPRSISEPRLPNWITTGQANSAAVFAREFDLEQAPRAAWLRLATTGPTRLAVNGAVVMTDRETLGTPQRVRPIERTIEIAPLLKAGKNTLSVAVTEGGEAPRVRAAFEATFRDGGHAYLGTDEGWFGKTGQAADWNRPRVQSDAEWTPCVAEIGYQGVVPRAVIRELSPLDPPLSFYLRRSAIWAGLVALCGLAGWAGSRQVFRLAEAAGDAPVTPTLPLLALVPTTVLAAAGALMTWDANWTSLEVYTVAWLTTLVLLVPIQWLLIVALMGGRQAVRGHGLAPPEVDRRLRRAGYVVAWIALLIGAFLLRARDLTSEPIHHDEVTSYFFTMSIFEYGFPGGKVHEDIPFGYCATSELSFYPNAIVALFVDDPLLIIRIPALCWSMATIALLGYIGTRWFNAQAGFVAALLFGVAPTAIGMANFGRYLSQVQFFALLSMFLAYECVKGKGPIRTGVLWGATVSFIAMYLSWEGTGIFGVGLALAALLARRDNLRSVITCGSFYMATLAVLLTAVIQTAHRQHQQTQRLWYGEGISSLSLKPMWRYPFFDVDFYLVNSSWTKDALVPMLAVGAACVLAISHRWRSPIRFALVSLIMNAGLMSTLLPLRSNRYAFHLSEIVILLAAAVGVAGAEAVVRAARGTRIPAVGIYARSVATVGLIVGVILASGWFLRTSELTSLTTAAQAPRQLKIPDWIEPTRFVNENFREGDVVISIFPHTQDFVLAQLNKGGKTPTRVGYWLESRLIVQATLGDNRDVPLDRRSGAVMLYDIEQIKQVFAEHDRVWYCTMRYAQSRINETEVSKYLREHMDVVFEDFATSVLLRDKNHRPAPQRLEEEEAGRLASDYYLK